MVPCPSRIASILAFTCCSITSLAVYIARLVTIKSEMKGITFFKKNMQCSEKKLNVPMHPIVHQHFLRCKTMQIWIIIEIIKYSCREIFLKKQDQPSVQSNPWYPLSQPSVQVPFMWWHCFKCRQLPQGCVQFSPNILLSHSKRKTNE